MLNERGVAKMFETEPKGIYFCVERAINICQSIFVGFKCFCWSWRVGSGRISWSRSKTFPREKHVNMDETMIRLWQGGRRELVKLEPFADRKLDKDERGSLAERRQNVFMLAFKSDCPHVVWSFGDLRRSLEPLAPLAQKALLLD